MAVTLSCPQCGQALSAAALPGQQIRCGSCNALFALPELASEPAPHETATLEHATAPSPPRTGTAITAMILGILGIVLCPVFALVGLILGIVALVRVNNRPAEYGGKGMANAGICCGGAGVVLSVIAIPITV